MLNCQLDANLQTGSGDSMHLSGICGRGGTVVDAMVTHNGQSGPIVLTLRDDGPGIDLSGKMPGGGSRFVAHIGMVTPND
jgi:hypothetical protein